MLREILAALDVAERRLLAGPAGVAEQSHRETQVATLQRLYRDLASTSGGRGYAAAIQSPPSPVTRAYGRRP